MNSLKPQLRILNRSLPEKKKTIKCYKGIIFELIVYKQRCAQNHCMNCPCEHLLLFDSGYVSKIVLKNIKPIWTRLLVYRQFIKSVLSYENVSLLVYLFDNFTLWPELKFHSFFFSPCIWCTHKSASLQNRKIFKKKI